MELTVSQMLMRGIEAQKVGEFKKADKLYRLILQKEPGHPHANHNLGVLLISQDQTIEAIPFFRNAIRSNPSVNQFWFSYLDALMKEKSYEEVRAAIADATTKLGDAPRPWVAAHLRRGDACRDGAYMGRTCSSGGLHVKRVLKERERLPFGLLGETGITTRTRKAC